MGNQERVENWRSKGGNDKQKELYNRLRKEYKIPSVQACKMKYWGKKRITLYLIENGYVDVSII